MLSSFDASTPDAPVAATRSVIGRETDEYCHTRRRRDRSIDLAPAIRAARDELDTMRQVPASLAQALADAGLLQMHLPRSMGGPEVSPLTAFHAIEALSKVEGSVGWCAMIASAVSLFVGWLPVEVGQDICGQPPNLRAAGSVRPEGKAYPVDGGYHVMGMDLPDA